MTNEIEKQFKENKKNSFGQSMNLLLVCTRSIIFSVKDMYQLLCSLMNSLAYIIILLSIASCSTHNRDAVHSASSMAHYTTNTKEFKGKVELLSDDVSFLQESPDSPLGDILYYANIAPDTAIIVSRTSGQAQLFVHDSFIRNIGKCGNGPGEYKGVSSISYHNDTLFILQRTKNVLGYSIVTGKQNFEFVHERMMWSNAMFRLSDGFLFADGIFEPEQDKSEHFIFAISHKQEVKEYPVTRGEMNVATTYTPVRQMFSVPFSGNERYVIGHFALTPYVTIVNRQDNSITLCKLQVHIQYPHDMVSKTKEEDRNILEHSDRIESVHCLSDKFAVVVGKPRAQNSSAVSYSAFRSYVQFYSYQGESLGEVLIPETDKEMYCRVVDVSESFITLLTLSKPTTNNQTVQPYTVTKRKYEIVL